MPSVIELFKLLQHAADAAQWTGEHNGKAIPSVEDVGAGINGMTLWVQARFTEDDEAHVLWGSVRLFGGETIKCDNSDVEGDDIVISPTPTKGHVVLEYKFRKEGQNEHYVFKTRG